MSRKKSKKIYRVLVVGQDKEARQMLADYYYKKLERDYARGAASNIYNAGSIFEAQKKSQGVLRGKLNLIIWSSCFLPDDKYRLRECLNDMHMATPFITFFGYRLL